MRSFFKNLLRFYRRFFSPFFGGQCRFHPTCSTYALEALEAVPLPVAVLKIARRIGSCHPFHSGGYDPVTVNGGGSPSVVNDQIDNVRWGVRGE